MTNAFVFGRQPLPPRIALGAGTISKVDDQGLWVACAQGQLILQQLQLPGKKAMAVSEILRGHPDLFKVGEQLEPPPC